MDDEKPEIEEVRAELVSRSPWRTWDAAARREFVELIHNGMESRSAVIAYMRLNRNTVSEWFARGKNREYDPADYECRHFTLAVRSAETARDAMPGMKMFEAAVGSVVEEVEHPDGRIERKRIPGDWRAAMEYGKRQERIAVLEHDVRAAAANADEAEADARVAFVKAAIAEQAAKKIAAMVIFQPEFIARCRPEVRALIDAEMERLKVIPTPEDMVDEILSGQDTSDIDELEEGLRRHPRRGPVDSGLS